MRRDLGWLWHGMIGLPIGAFSGWLLVLGSFWALGALLLLSLTAAIFYLREIRQHDPVLTRHQRIEAITALLGYSLGLLTTTLLFA